MNFSYVMTDWGKMYHLIEDNDSLLLTLSKKKVYQPYIINLASQYGDKIIIDIGANIGAHSIPIAKQNNNKVYAFEACSGNVSCLEKNKNYHQCDNLDIFPYALGSTKTSNIFYQVPTRRGASSFDPTGLDMSTVVKKKVECFPLDHFLSQLEPVSFIKIDVQNFEYQVLLGATQLIERDKPAILVECPGRNLYEQMTYQKITHFFKKIGYYEKKRFNKDCLFCAY